MKFASHCTCNATMIGDRLPFVSKLLLSIWFGKTVLQQRYPFIRNQKCVYSLCRMMLEWIFGDRLWEEYKQEEYADYDTRDLFNNHYCDVPYKLISHIVPKDFIPVSFENHKKVWMGRTRPFEQSVPKNEYWSMFSISNTTVETEHSSQRIPSHPVLLLLLVVVVYLR